MEKGYDQRWEVEEGGLEVVGEWRERDLEVEMTLMGAGVLDDGIGGIDEGDQRQWEGNGKMELRRRESKLQECEEKNPGGRITRRGEERWRSGESGIESEVLGG